MDLPLAQVTNAAAHCFDYCLTLFWGEGKIKQGVVRSEHQQGAFQ